METYYQIPIFPGPRLQAAPAKLASAAPLRMAEIGDSRLSPTFARSRERTLRTQAVGHRPVTVCGVTTFRCGTSLAHSVLRTGPRIVPAGFSSGRRYLLTT